MASKKWTIQRTLKLLERKEYLAILEIEKIGEMKKLLKQELKKL